MHDDSKLKEVHAFFTCYALGRKTHVFFLYLTSVQLNKCKIISEFSGGIFFLL